MTTQPNKALLVIDVQEIYTNPDMGLYCSDANKTLNRINQLIADFVARNQPVIYIKHAHKADRSDLGRMFDFAGPTDVADFLDNTPEVNFSTGLTITNKPIIVHKNRYSSFHNTNLQTILQDHNIDHIVICGFMTNFCCESAARDAHDLDYFVDFIVDATGTPGVDSFDQDATRHAVSQMLSAGFAVVKTTDEYLA